MAHFEVAAYKEWMSLKIESARQAAEPEPDCLPHPDDILIKTGKRARIVGPATREELEKQCQHCALRDTLLMQEALEGNPSGSGTPLMFAVLINDTLPARLRLDDGTLLMRLSRHMACRKRVLAKTTRKAWLDLGHKAKREAHFPGREACASALLTRFDYIIRRMSGTTARI